MSFTPKAWMDFPNKTTPRDAQAQKDLEQRVASYSAYEAIPPGVGGYQDFRVKQNGGGAAMNVDVGLAGTEMFVWVRGTDRGVYRYLYNGAQLIVAIGANSSGNPRVDRVVATAPISSDSIVPRILVLPGTPAGGATLDTLTGAQAIPAGYLLLADVVVANGAATIVTANIRDRRQAGGQASVSGVMPWLLTARDEVAIDPDDAFDSGNFSLTPTTHDNMQGAYLANISRKIEGATRIRWRYSQGATPATSNYNIAILDMSGRLIIASGATAFAGAANSFNEIALTIAATNFESGPCFVWLGVAPLTASSAVSFLGVQGATTVTATGVPFRNHKLHSASGSTTFPAANTVLGYTDVAGAAAAGTYLPMPQIALSVG